MKTTQELLAYFKNKYPKHEFDLIEAKDVLQTHYNLNEINLNDYPKEMISFSFEGICITDPFASCCSRFQVNPNEEYNILQKDAQIIIEHNKFTIH